MSGAVFLVSVFLVPESRYSRSLVAYNQVEVAVAEGKLDDLDAAPAPMRISERPALDFVTYQPRTIWSDMRVFVDKPDWVEGWYAFKVRYPMLQPPDLFNTDPYQNTFQVILFPNVLWAFLINGLTIGTNIAMGYVREHLQPTIESENADYNRTTYAAIVTAPPYNWPNKTASYVNTGQIVVALIALPLLGNGSDFVIKWKARRNGGVHEPETRLLLLWLPVLVGIISAVIYGQAGSHPEKYHWFAIVFAYAGYVSNTHTARDDRFVLTFHSTSASWAPTLQQSHTCWTPTRHARHRSWSSFARSVASFLSVPPLA